MLLPLLVLIQAPPAGERPSALLGRALARYASARTIQGQITFEQAAGGQKVVAVTEIAIERPNLLRLRQTSDKGPTSSLLTSDGIRYSYDGPLAPTGTNRVRLMDGAMRRQEPLPLSEMIRSARPSLLDQYSPYFEIVTGELGELKRLKSRWLTVEDGGTEALGGVPCRVVRGNRGADALGGGAGTYRMWITSDARIVAYETREVYSIADVAKDVVVLTRWTGDLKLDEPIPPAVFRLVP